MEIEDHRVHGRLDQRDAGGDRHLARQRIGDTEPHREMKRPIADGLKYVPHDADPSKAVLATYSYLKEWKGKSRGNTPDAAPLTLPLPDGEREKGQHFIPSPLGERERAQARRRVRGNGRFRPNETQGRNRGRRGGLDTILEMKEQVGMSVTLVKERDANIPHAEIENLVPGFGRGDGPGFLADGHKRSRPFIPLETGRASLRMHHELWKMTRSASLSQVISSADFNYLVSSFSELSTDRSTNLVDEMISTHDGCGERLFRHGLLKLIRRPFWSISK